MLNQVYSKLNHILALSFENTDLEKKFQKAYLAKNLTQNRLATVLALVANICYLLVVYTVNPEDIVVSMKIVFFVVFPSGIFFLYLSTRRHFQDYILFYLFSVMIIVGSGSVLALYFTNGNYQLIYTVFILPIIGIFLMSGAPFVISLLSTTVLIIAFIIAMFLIQLSSHHIVFVTFLISSSFVFSAISGYLAEKSNRKNFLAISTQEELNRCLRDEQMKNILQERVIHRQARLAQMGEMISMIAHQWRQPLSAISALSTSMQIKIELENYELLSKEEFQDASENLLVELKNIDEYVQRLSATINDFKDFFKPNKNSVLVSLEKLVKKSLDIVKSSVINDDIQLIQEYSSKQEVKVYDNELMHVVLNLLKNAQDNFQEKDIAKPFIKIVVEDTKISISDNGGGVPSDIIDNIFDPYFSTKNERNGTGLGLYMSKTIIEEHHNGSLSVSNINDGACFTIELGEIL